MATRSINQEMLQYFMQLNDAEKKSVLQVIKTFLKSKMQPSERISIEQYNKELEMAEEEFEKGKYVTHEELLKHLQQC